MTKTTKKYDDGREFVILTISRNDVRLVCGDAVADRLSDANVKRLPREMAETCDGNSFAEGLQRIIEYKFSESSEQEEE